MWQFVRFLLVGVVNTGIGAGTIFALMALGVGPVLANMLGYAVGLCTSFGLNRGWTFRSERPVRQALLPFAITFAVAYSASLAVLLGCLHGWRLDPYVAQAVAIAVYTLLSFVGMRRFAFVRGR